MAEDVDLPRAILGAVPATMRELGRRVGVGGPVLWETTRAMRRAGFLHRGAARVYELGRKPMPDGWRPDPEVLDAARKAGAGNGGGGPQKTATLLVSVPNWPPQEPGRTMVFSTARNQREANAELKRLMMSVPGVDWSVARLTAAERRRIRDKPVPARGTDGARQAGEVGSGEEPETGVTRGDDATTQQKNI